MNISPGLAEKIIYRHSLKGIACYDQNNVAKSWQCKDLENNHFKILQFNNLQYALTDIEDTEKLPLRLEVIPRYEIVPHKFLQHKITGEKASIFSSSMGDNWEIKQNGFTVRDNLNNTRGAYCLKSGSSIADCEEFINKSLTHTAKDFI